MRLTPVLVERTLSQFKAEAVPDSHPAISQLNRLFGNHTFFLDSNGLNIVEPAGAAQAGVQKGQIVNVASWSDGDPQRLEPHEPEPTDVVVTLELKH